MKIHKRKDTFFAVCGFFDRGRYIKKKHDYIYQVQDDWKKTTCKNCKRVKNKIKA